MSTIPGPRSHQLGESLRKWESRGVTYLASDFPIFWQSAQGSRVVDADGNTYIDFTAAFGAASVGHSNAVVVSAIQEQAAALMHAMGDVHPPAIRVRLLEKLAQIAPGDLSKTYLCSTGSEAIEAALKTALLCNGKPGVIAFNGCYHGLSLGALEVCGLPRFRQPFADALKGRTLFVDYPRRERSESLARAMAALSHALARRKDIGALVVEPILGRGGVIVPPDGFLRELRHFCDEHRIVLIFDEILTGFGRTGTFFASQHESVVPDVLCLGKAIANGFPISAAVGKPQIMDAWPPSQGEALHTSTYLGNPMGCAAALATIGQIEHLDLPRAVQGMGATLETRLQALRQHRQVIDVRGRGLLWGIEFESAGSAESLVRRALSRGLILSQQGTVVSITPPLTIETDLLESGLNIVFSLLEDPVIA